MSNITKDDKRLLDLVRHCRAQLHEDGLITDQEYADLAMVGSESARRLESYDEVKAQLAETKELLEKAIERGDHWTDEAAKFAEQLAEARERKAKLEENAITLLMGRCKTQHEGGFADLVEQGMDQCPICMRIERDQWKRRLEWLHEGCEKDAEGYEWGVFRVKWDTNGQPVSVLHTLSNLSDLDAEIAAFERLEEVQR